MTFDSAQVLALRALAHLLSSGPPLDRFLAETGADPSILRERAGEPEFLAAVMDFVLADDALAGAFCETEAVDPRDLHLARHALPGG